MRSLKMYTDGACKYNPGPGGYACIIVYGDKEKILTGFEKETTNNRMELLALIKGLDILKETCHVDVTTDSKYVCDSINEGWINKWHSSGWMKKGSPIPNSDLWMKLWDLLEIHEVTLSWVKGHDGHPYNERCDKLAVSEIEKNIQMLEALEIPIYYCDAASGGTISPEVAKTITKVMEEYKGNPSSMHEYGKQSRDMLEGYRNEISGLLKCDPEEIIFTSGGTEANNIGIMGLALGNANKGKHIICSNAEHSSVYNTCIKLKSLGFDVTFIDPNEDGMITAELLKQSIRNDTILVCIMHVNNEYGIVNPIGKLADICHDKGVLFFSDGVAAIPHLKVDFEAYKVDAYSISGHKFGTPPGIGILFLRKDCKFESTILGGNQEFSKRAGTENLPYIAGIATALKNKSDSRMTYTRVKENTNLLIELLRKIDDTVINGSVGNRIAGNVSVSFLGVSRDALLLKLNENGVYVSTKSACELSDESNRVISCVQKDSDYIKGTIRLSFYNEISEADIYSIAEIISNCVNELRNM